MTPLATATAPILQAAQLAAENGPALLAIDGALRQRQVYTGGISGGAAGLSGSAYR